MAQEAWKDCAENRVCCAGYRRRSEGGHPTTGPIAHINGPVHIWIMHIVGRSFLILLAAAPFLGACPTTTVAGGAVSTVDAPAATDRLIGITATGPQADIDRLQALATKSGFPSKQMDSPEGWELFVLFPPKSEASAVAAFLEHLHGDEFSALQFGSAMAPASP